MLVRRVVAIGTIRFMKQRVTTAVTSDLKRAGSKLVLVGETFCEMGGALYGGGKGKTPAVRESAPAIMRAVASAIRTGAVLACHDLSDGGLAAAAAEMAIAGNFGVRIDPAAMTVGEPIDRVDHRLFSESATRFLLEVEDVPQLDVPHAVIGEVTENGTIDFGDALQLSLESARSAFFHWEDTLR